MKRKLLLVATALAVLTAGSVAFAKSTGVQITSAGFNPKSVSIQTGDSMT